MIDDNKVADIGAIANLVNLKKVYMCSNQIETISKPLNKLTKLEDFCIPGNNIKDISNISGLINLKRLYLNGNKIEDISILDSNPNIEELVLYKNNIKSLHGLEGMKRLHILSTDKNYELSDIEALRNIPMHPDWNEEHFFDAWLSFGDCNISNISSLVDTPILNKGGTVDLSNNQIRCDDPLLEKLKRRPDVNVMAFGCIE